MLTQEWHTEYEEHRITVRNSAGVQGLSMDLLKTSIKSEAVLYIDGQNRDTNDQLINLGKHPCLRGSIERPDGQRPAVVEVYLKPTLKKSGYNCEIYVDDELMPLVGESKKDDSQSNKHVNNDADQQPGNKRDYKKWLIIGVVVVVVLYLMDEFMNDGGGGTFDSGAEALYCCDIYGNQRCPLITPGAVGAPCFCPGQGNGTMCN